MMARPKAPRSWQTLPLVLGILSLSVLDLPFATPVMAQEKMQRVLTVSGRGVEAIATTLTRVNLGVEVQAKTAAAAQAEAARKSTAVVTLLKSRNVENLETTGINLNPTYDYTNNRQVLTGYNATNTVTFKIKTEQAGDLLDDAVKGGATRIEGVSFTATDEAIAAAQKVALKKATQDAQAQANAVLGALGFQAKEIVGIQVNGATSPPPRVYAMMEAAKSMAQSAPTPVIGGEQQVDGSVTLQISY
jgi:uncharacterized protein